MACKLANYVECGEIDCRTAGRVTGRLWLRGLQAPVELELEGDAYVDLDGHCLSFRNHRPVAMPKGQRGIERVQRGRVGSVTAARKVKVPDDPIEVLEELGEDIETAPFNWANALYIEWVGVAGERFVLESSDFELEIDPKDDRLTRKACIPERLLDPTVEDADDAPQSRLEADAAEGASELERLFRRVNARLATLTEIDHTTEDRIMREERDRLRVELGKAAIEPGSPMEDEEDLFWEEEWAARHEELFEADLCPVDEERRNPLVVRCQDLSLQLAANIEDYGWIEGHATREHPLHEITNSLCSAAPKLAGALNLQDRWPPDPYFAATSLPRLKQARRFLREAVIGVHAARQEKLAHPEWLDAAETDAANLYQAVNEIITQARKSIANRYDPFL